MKEATHTRKGKNIINLATGDADTHKSFNGAKRASRKIQMNADGALGRGSLRVTPTQSKRGVRQLAKEVIQRMRTGR